MATEKVQHEYGADEIQILEVRQHRNNVQSYYSYGKWQGRLYLWRRRSRHDGVFLCQKGLTWQHFRSSLRMTG